MDKSTIIIILAVILFILIILNHITIVKTPTTSSPPISTNTSNNGNKNSNNKQPTCADTQFGCCPDGVNSKINYYGTNCPQYNPGPGYQLQPTPVKQVPPSGLALSVTGVPGL